MSSKQTKKQGKAEQSPPSKPSTPKKARTTVVCHRLASDSGAPIPIAVSFEGAAVAIQKNKSGKYIHNLRLEAPNSFSLVETTIIASGPHEGKQAIIIQPAKSFPFLKLPKSVRARVYMFYFAQRDPTTSAVMLEGKRPSSRELWAKAYAEGSKERVALVAVSREVHDEAVPALYALTLRFESTTTLLDFLGQIEPTVRARLTRIDVKQYVKTTSRNAMHFLGEASGLERLHLDTGVSSEQDPSRAARNFYGDAYRMLEAVCATKRGDKDAAVAVLSFGPRAFVVKDEEKGRKPWSTKLVQEFREALRAKLK